MPSSVDRGTPGDTRWSRLLILAEHLIRAQAWSPLLPFLSVALVVVLQTVRARGAWFYADDWTAMALVETGLSGAFALHNGQLTTAGFVPYDALYAVFGMAHYSAFLLAAGLCNLAFGFAVVWWLRPRVSVPVQVLVAVSCLVVPQAAHTIFWLGAALNLLPTAGLLMWLGALQRQSRWSLPILLSGAALSLGLGGYGIAALVGFLVAALLVRHRPSQAIAGIALAASVVPQAINYLSSSGVAGRSAPSLLSWLYGSLESVTAAIVLPIPVLIVAIVALLTLSRRQVSVDDRSRSTPDSALLIARSHLDVLAITATLGTYVVLIYLVRHGVETLDASRYILIVVSQSTLLMVAIATTVTRQQILRQRSFVGASLVVVLACTTFLRVPRWMNQSTNAAYLGGMNRAAVTQLICAGETNAQIAQTLANQDGLGALGAAMPTKIWSDFRSNVAENCLP